MAPVARAPGAPGAPGAPAMATPPEVATPKPGDRSLLGNHSPNGKFQVSDCFFLILPRYTQILAGVDTLGDGFELC